MACHACLLANASGVASANAGLSDLTLPWLAVGSAKVATLQRFKRGKPIFRVRNREILRSTFAEQEAKIAELKSADAEQRKEIRALTAALKEQAAQIQKVSCRVEMSQPATRIVSNRP